MPVFSFTLHLNVGGWVFKFFAFFVWLVGFPLQVGFTLLLWEQKESTLLLIGQLVRSFQSSRIHPNPHLELVKASCPSSYGSVVMKAGGEEVRKTGAIFP